MKVVILAGGFGTRLSEETEHRPKPMVEIDGRPILWHIMKHYAHYGFNEFVIALGYKGEAVKRFFLDYHWLNSNMTISVATGDVKVQDGSREDWTIHLVDTGLNTMTGGRVKRVKPWLDDGTFMVTYGDGVSDVNLRGLLEFHRSCGKLATVTAVRPPARFGGISLEKEAVRQFTEKPQAGEGWINGGYLVMEPQVIDLIAGDSTSLERNVLEHLASTGELSAFRHEEFWQCMDTLRDLRLLEELWQTGQAPWKVWQD